MMRKNDKGSLRCGSVRRNGRELIGKHFNGSRHGCRKNGTINLKTGAVRRLLAMTTYKHSERSI
jgi:hypothetical protein